MRRASAELERRRASLGATRGLRADGTLDPNYAAILFRDSRGVSTNSALAHPISSHAYLTTFLHFPQLPVADPFLEKFNMSDHGVYFNININNNHY